MTDQEAKPEHRLAAIMATDVVGYSKLIQSDEAGALAALAFIQEVTQSQIKQHRGRIANTAGDSVLAEFGSAVEAVSCAVALQQELSNHTQSDLQVRIGIHLGDVVEKAGDLFGTAVNVAARLEGIAQPGAIVVSAAVRDAVPGKLPASFSDLGLKTLKNMDEPLRAYALSPRAGSLSPGTPRTGEALPLPSKPSIAVLPFDDLSGERDQEYFADGMVEEIITALSRFRGLFVIARNSSFAYKGRTVNVREVGRELGVRYILEGSVRKAGNRLRISGQLIDATTSMHLWAERFDGDLADIFDLQDQVTTSVVGAIAPKLEQAEIERTKHRPTDSLDAYDCYLRGLAGLHRFTKEDNSEALSHFRRAVELDPNFAAAYGMAARCYAQRKAGRWMADLDLDIAEAARLARRAVELGHDDAVALCTAGYALADVVNELEDGDNLIDRALTLNPNLAMAWIFSGWVKISLGSPELAIERLTHAMRLNPQDSYYFGARAAMASAHLAAGRYDEALSWAETALRAKPGFLFALCIAAASAALAGRGEAMRKAMMLVRQNDPQLRLSNLKEVISGLQPAEFARWQEGLRLAGLPE
jgi:TolB-like protein/class 3 adenylate cyclase/Tfp pilus assembly protein PilF